jgi:hypothetical protein
VDKNRSIHALFDYSETLQSTQSDSPDALNSTYVECHRRIQALKALGENTDDHGQILYGYAAICGKTNSTPYNIL